MPYPFPSVIIMNPKIPCYLFCSSCVAHNKHPYNNPSPLKVTLPDEIPQSKIATTITKKNQKKNLRPNMFVHLLAFIFSLNFLYVM